MATAPIDVIDDAPVANDSLSLLAQIAQAKGDISSLFEEGRLNKIGSDVIDDYERDLGDRCEWEEQARKALKRAAQEREEYPDAPFYRNSHINFPILTVASQQFNARAYPSICKPGNMVRCKVIGSDKGRPRMVDTPQGKVPVVSLNGQEMPLPVAIGMIQQEVAALPPAQEGQEQPQLSQPEPVWDVPPGFKAKRADRISDYMNVVLEFRVDDWEEDTDLLLTQLPIIGCGFRKLWWDDGKQCAAYVSALDLVVPVAAKSLKTTPRISEKLPPTFPYQLRERMNAGEYRFVELHPDGDDAEEPRELIEQHRLLDLDGDGVDEPYIITVDKESRKVLRIVANFDVDDVHLAEDGRIKRIEREQFYVKYGFLPDPKGGFYDIGFGHLIEQLGDAINATIDMMLDAGHAQIAGGGFIAGGLRLQSNNRTETMRWMPGEYKVVNVNSGDLRSGIVERTFPNVSPVMFQLLELLLGAAKEITSVKDVVTGDAPNTAPVGTTLALIQQGLTVFTAIIKRVYRSLGIEFGMMYQSMSRYGGEEMAEDYMNVLDDPEADFAKDFGEKDIDVKPVADPSAITNMQRLAKAQVVMQIASGNPLIDQKEALTRVFEAADIEDIDKLFAPPSGPDPLAIAEAQQKMSAAVLNEARAAKAQSETIRDGVEIGIKLAGGDQ